jgi:hypothetical protein
LGLRNDASASHGLTIPLLGRVRARVSVGGAAVDGVGAGARAGAGGWGLRPRCQRRPSHNMQPTVSHAPVTPGPASPALRPLLDREPVAAQSGSESAGDRGPKPRLRPGKAGRPGVRPGVRREGALGLTRVARRRSRGSSVCPSYALLIHVVLPSAIHGVGGWARSASSARRRPASSLPRRPS